MRAASDGLRCDGSSVLDPHPGFADLADLDPGSVPAAARALVASRTVAAVMDGRTTCATCDGMAVIRRDRELVQFRPVRRSLGYLCDSCHIRYGAPTVGLA